MRSELILEAVDEFGNVVQNARFQVFEPGTSNAVTVWDTPTGVAPVVTPLLSDALGRRVLYVETPARYDVVVSDNRTNANDPNTAQAFYPRHPSHKAKFLGPLFTNGSYLYSVLSSIPPEDWVAHTTGLLEHGWSVGTYAARPAAAQAGRFYWATDAGMLFRDDGAKWVEITPMANLRAFAVGNGVANDTDAVADWFSAITAHGGVGFAPPGTYNIDSDMLAPNDGDLLGRMRLSIFRAVDSDARIRFGPLIVEGQALPQGHRGGESAGLTGDGNGMADSIFYWGLCVERGFRDFRAINCAGPGLAWRGPQNCYTDNFSAEGNQGGGIVIDHGASYTDFGRIGANRNGGRSITFTQSIVNPAGIPAVPTGNSIRQALPERVATSGPATTGLVLHDAGLDNAFDYLSAAIASGASSTIPLIEMRSGQAGNAAATSQRLLLADCYLQGQLGAGSVPEFITGIALSGSTSLYITGSLRLIGLVNGFDVPTNTPVVEIAGGRIIYSNVTNKTAGAGNPETYMRRRRDYVESVTRPLTTSTILVGMVDGETGARFRDRADGRRDYGSGADFAYGLSTYRASDGRFRVDGNLFFTGSGNVEIDGALDHDGTTVGFYGVNPQARPAAYTQNYATTSRTVNAYTPDVESTPYTGATDGEAKLADLNALRVAYENLRAAVENLMQVHNQHIDDHQANGLLQ